MVTPLMPAAVSTRRYRGAARNMYFFPGRGVASSLMTHSRLQKRKSKSFSNEDTWSRGYSYPWLSHDSITPQSSMRSPQKSSVALGLRVLLSMLPHPHRNMKRTAVTSRKDTLLKGDDLRCVPV